MRGMLLFLFALLGCQTLAMGDTANHTKTLWHIADAPYRIELTSNKDSGWQYLSLKGMQFSSPWEGGIVVTNERGESLPFIHQKGDSLTVIVQKPAKGIFVYYGLKTTPAQKPINVSKALSTYAGPLLLRTASVSGGVKNYEELKTYFETAKLSGWGVVEEIKQDRNIFVPESNRGAYVSHYTGQLKVDESGYYTFGINSDDSSFLAIDGKLQLSWPGLHGKHHDFGRKKKIHLEKGHHTIDFYHHNVGGGSFASVGYKPPHHRRWIVLDQTLFKAPGKLAITRSVSSDGILQPYAYIRENPLVYSDTDRWRWWHVSVHDLSDERGGAWTLDKAPLSAQPITDLMLPSDAKGSIRWTDAGAKTARFSQALGKADLMSTPLKRDVNLRVWAPRVMMDHETIQVDFEVMNYLPESIVGEWEVVQGEKSLIKRALSLDAKPNMTPTGDPDTFHVEPFSFDKTIVDAGVIEASFRMPIAFQKTHRLSLVSQMAWHKPHVIKEGRWFDADGVQLIPVVTLPDYVQRQQFAAENVAHWMAGDMTPQSMLVMGDNWKAWPDVLQTEMSTRKKALRFHPWSPGSESLMACLPRAINAMAKFEGDTLVLIPPAEDIVEGLDFHAYVRTLALLMQESRQQKTLRHRIVVIPPLSSGVLPADAVARLTTMAQQFGFAVVTFEVPLSVDVLSAQRRGESIDPAVMKAWASSLWNYAIEPPEFALDSWHPTLMFHDEPMEFGWQVPFELPVSVPGQERITVSAVGKVTSEADSRTMELPAKSPAAMRGEANHAYYRNRLLLDRTDLIPGTTIGVGVTLSKQWLGKTNLAIVGATALPQLTWTGSGLQRKDGTPAVVKLRRPDWTQQRQWEALRKVQAMIQKPNSVALIYPAGYGHAVQSLLPGVSKKDIKTESATWEQFGPSAGSQGKGDALWTPALVKASHWLDQQNLEVLSIIAPKSWRAQANNDRVVHRHLAALISFARAKGVGRIIVGYAHSPDDKAYIKLNQRLAREYGLELSPFIAKSEDDETELSSWTSQWLNAIW